MKIIPHHDHPLPPLPPEDEHFEQFRPHPITPPPKDPNGNYIYHHEGYPIYVSFANPGDGGSIRPEWLRQGLIHALELETRLSGVDSLSVVVGELSGDVAEISAYVGKTIHHMKVHVMEALDTAKATRADLHHHIHRSFTHFTGEHQYNDMTATIDTVKAMSAEWGKQCSCNFGELSAKVDTLSTIVTSDLSTKVGELDTNLTKLSNDYQTTKKNVNTLKKETTDKFNEVNREIDVIESDVSELAKGVAKAESNASKALTSAQNIVNQIPGIERDVAAAKLSATTAYNAVKALSTDLPNQVKTVIETDNEVKRSISSIVDSQISGVKKTAEDAAKTADEALVSAQTAISNALDAKFTASSALISAQTALNRIDDLSSNISSSVSVIAESTAVSAAQKEIEETVQPQLTSISSDLSGAKQDISERILPSITKFEEDIDKIKPEISTISGNIDDISNNVDGISNDVTAISNDVGTISTSVETATSTINDLSTFISSDIAPSVSTLISGVSDISTFISGLNQSGDKINQISVIQDGEDKGKMTITSVDIVNVVQQNQETQYLVIGDVTGSGANWID